MNAGWLMGVALITAVGGLFLQRYNPGYALVLVIAGGAFLLLRSVAYLNEIFTYVDRLSAAGTVQREWLKQLIKAVGICCMAKFGADICRDAGEIAMAGYVELTGRILIVWLALPLLGQIADTVLNLLSL